ncbi:PepSY domain-containing protein [Nitrospina gracilis]|uniref:PepSY domain-containing protein n=1 Tax=Nitrospina gracilis TaxID=35801 RepID=UPI001F19D936|nr:PepSY domain-containing protein [Nitrospina gracilis]MCF8721812.1 putative membrane protein YkoI [Nitrospina gracilis Nb-211]
MKNWKLTATMVLSLMLMGFSGCGLLQGKKTVTLDEVSEPARSVIQTHTSRNDIESIHAKRKDGERVYKVHYRKGGKLAELQVTEKGSVKEWEESVELEELPEAVRATVTRLTDRTAMKELVKEIEDGHLFYEVEFMKDDKENEVKIAEDGSILEWETE